MNRLLLYPWYGNVRELQNVLERAAILARDNHIRIDNQDLVSTELVSQSKSCINQTLAEVEKQHIEATLSQVNGKIAGKGGAADVLGLHPNTLRARMIKHGLL